MKTFALLGAAIALTATSATAFSLGDITGGDKCVDQAATLVKQGGKDVVKAYEAYSANQSLSASDLNISKEALGTLNSYVDSGCAKDHLQQALKAGGAAKGLF